MAPMRAFSILQKWSKIAKMTQDDLLTLAMISFESYKKYWIKHSFSFLKFIILVKIERKNDINGNNANYSL